MNGRNGWIHQSKEEMDKWMGGWIDEWKIWIGRYMNGRVDR